MTDFIQMRSQLIEELTVPSPVESLSLDWPGAQSLNITIKRDDCIHAIISGNKWRKLAVTFRKMTVPPPRIVSFGGGFSNHLHALGYICHRLSIPFTAIIRGNYQGAPTPTISDLTAWGTDIHYVSKKDYQRRHSPTYHVALNAQFPKAMIIPEGGSQRAALEGIRQLIFEQPVLFDTVMCPVASGATLAGVVSALAPNQRAVGIGVLKGQGYLESLVNTLLPDNLPNWHIEHAYTHGGYAKQNAELVTFCEDFTRQTMIPVEPVYSGKLLFALKKMIGLGHFPAGHRILLLHTGGLQGARSH